MADEKATSLYREIEKKTIDGRIPWEPTADEVIFIAPVKGKYVFEFRPYTWIDSDTGEPQGYPSIVFKENDREITIMTYQTLSGVVPDQINKLYAIVKRQALRVDEKIDDVLGEIGNL